VVSEPRQQGTRPVVEVVPSRTFEDLVRDEAPRLFAALRLLSRDRAEAEDLMQEAFLRVWERWDRVGGMDDPVGYLFRTALNLHRKRLRRAGVMLRRAIAPAPPFDAIAEVESRDAVLRALATLTPRQRMSVVLTDLLDYPSAEAAKVMGISASTVRVLASQGRATLRREVHDGEG